MSAQREMNEPILADDYPVNADYWYLVDGKPRRSPVYGSVRLLKFKLGASEIRRCDAVARDLPIW